MGLRRMLLGAMLALLLVGSLRGTDEKQAHLKFVVVKARNGKPIRNAAVVLHLVDKDGKQSKGGYELKTDGEGRANFDGAPYGKLRVQVLTPGYQTFGEDFDINQPEQQIVIKLKKPQDQVSIYK